MKALVMALALVGVTSAAHAGETVLFPHLGGPGNPSIAQLCDTGKGTFRTVKPIKVCDLKQVGWAGSHGEESTINEFVNVNCRMAVVTVSKKYAGREIVSWPMGEGSEAPVTKPVTKTYPNTWNVDVQADFGEASQMRTIKYTIPMCK